jgi:all-trans-8'-apo-beta-carotenal 15,15'-oxygenase
MHDDDGYLRSFTELSREHGFEPLRVDGTIPRGLDGTLYRNGPGLFSIAGHRYQHWFDGDGLVSALRLSDGRAEGASKLVVSRGLSEERRRGRAYYGAYGTKPPGPWNPWRALRFLREGGKNPANTSMLVWNDRLFALCEVGPPTEIDPGTLDTIGETNLDGAIVRPFSAHPHRHASSGAIYNVGVRIGRPNAIDLMLMRPDGTAGRVASIPLAAPTLIHDFVLTEHYAVIFAAPLHIALGRVLFGRTSFAGAMSWDVRRGTEVIVVPLDAPATPIRFETDAFWAWHVGNAFERGGEIVADVVRYASFDTSARWLEGVMRGAPGEADGYLTRLVIDPRGRSLRRERMRERTGEFPRVMPDAEARSHRLMYLLEHSDAEAGRRGPPDELVRLDVESGLTSHYRFARHEWPSEAVPLPEGFVVTLVYDARAHQSAWWIFDDRAIADGPVARAVLEHHVPLGFHGAWRPKSRG